MLFGRLFHKDGAATEKAQFYNVAPSADYDHMSAVI